LFSNQVSVSKDKRPSIASKSEFIDIRPIKGWTDIGFGELWRYRELAYFLVWRAVKIRYKQTVIGAAWAVIQPLATMLVFSLFFGRLARIPSGDIPYPVFYFAALLPWTYFAGAVQNVTNSVVEQQHVITKVYFPRLLLPISAAIPGLFDFAIGLLVFFPIMLAYQISPGKAILALPAFLLLAVLTALSVGIWLAAMNSLYRDVHHVIPFLVQIWMFASPVVYPATLVPERWRWLYGLNPMAGVIEGFRWALTGSGQPPTPMLAVSAAAVIVALTGGLIFFNRMEAIIADVV
jgi:ABC-type polysaccharide/polyol phosphate export systems, permease component